MRQIPNAENGFPFRTGGLDRSHGVSTLIVGFAVAWLLGACGPTIPEDAPDEIDAVRSFGSVVDGDTIRTGAGSLIRLIGVDAPEVDGPYTELEPGGEEAASFLKSFLEGSDVVYLSFGDERKDLRKDEHGRLLAYVYREGDYRPVNRALLEAGWARAYRNYRYRKKKEFRRAERKARRQKVGIWKMKETK